MVDAFITPVWASNVIERCTRILGSIAGTRKSGSEDQGRKSLSTMLGSLEVWTDQGLMESGDVGRSLFAGPRNEASWMRKMGGRGWLTPLRASRWAWKDCGPDGSSELSDMVGARESMLGRWFGWDARLFSQLETRSRRDEDRGWICSSLPDDTLPIDLGAESPEVENIAKLSPESCRWTCILPVTCSVSE